jgi:hypothetical protein
MKTISKENVDQSWKEAMEAPPEKAREWMEEMMHHQPSLDAFLFTADEHYSPSDERGVIFILGFIIWKIMSSHRNGSKTVHRHELKSAQEANIQKMYDLVESTEASFFESAAKMIQSHNQMPLLGHVIEALQKNHLETNKPADANLRLAMVYLKTVTDCLDRA